MTVSDVSSIVATVLAITAIALSIVFFRMSCQLSEATRSAAERIGASVTRLERLFEMLYSDTFALMKDTYTDMRRHVWPETKPDDALSSETEQRAAEKLSELTQGLRVQLDGVLDKQARTEGEVAGLKENLLRFVHRAVADSRRVEEEAVDETIRANIARQLKALESSGGHASASDLVGALERGFSLDRILRELSKMKAEGLISYQDDPVRPTTVIRFEKAP